MKKRKVAELLVERAFTTNIADAERLLLAGKVNVDGSIYDKAGAVCAEHSVITVQNTGRYVSRGGEKLEAALKFFGIDLKDKIVLDIGSSTGGFSDCMLQSGAKKLYAIDVGTNQLDWKLRKDARVVVREQSNARNVDSFHRAEFEPMAEFATVDVSFISATLVLDTVQKLLSASGSCLVLVKPHFELEREDVSAGGVVESEALRQKACAKVARALEERSWRVSDPFKSPLKGEKGGNEEYFLYAIPNMHSTENS